MTEEIHQLYFKAKEENDFITLLQLAKEYVMPKDVRYLVYDVCLIFFSFLKY